MFLVQRGSFRADTKNTTKIAPWYFFVTSLAGLLCLVDLDCTMEECYQFQFLLCLMSCYSSNRLRGKNSSMVLSGLASLNVLTMLEVHQATLIWHSLSKRPIQICQSRFTLLSYLNTFDEKLF